MRKGLNGMRIKNDETVLCSTAIKIAEGMLPYRVVLRQVTDSYQPYITHMENMRLEEGNVWVHESYYWGHYFSTKEDAENDFKTRARDH